MSYYLVGDVGIGGGGNIHTAFDLPSTISKSSQPYFKCMKYTSVELSVDRSIVRLTFDQVPEGYERFQRITIHADDLFTILVHVDEAHHDERQASGARQVQMD